jgi:hypothetical protein
MPISTFGRNERGIEGVSFLPQEQFFGGFVRSTLAPRFDHQAAMM